jgi:hypothetical protein
MASNRLQQWAASDPTLVVDSGAELPTATSQRGSMAISLRCVNAVETAVSQIIGHD